jgi:hypothetical protein
MKGGEIAQGIAVFSLQPVEQLLHVGQTPSRLRPENQGIGLLGLGLVGNVDPRIRE